MGNTNIEDKLKKVLDFITCYTEENGFPPSVREIGAELAIKSTATTYYYLEKLKEQGQISAHRIRILMKTNPQSDFLPLDKIASGGEMSRIFLAIETVFGTDHSVDSMLYDEVDAGVGPRMAMTVGEKLKELSKDKQLIVITHMPQVANLAEKHLKITKVQSKDEVYSTVTELTGEQREKEIKDMYGEIIV